MEQKNKSGAELPEIRTRIPLWLYPSTLETVDCAMAGDNCKSRSEFIENAIRFYAGYLSGEDAVEFLPAALVSALRATVERSEEHISRLLFKLAVEQDMMMNVLDAGLEINTEALDDLRGRCVQNVRRASGVITFKDAVKYQNREEVLRTYKDDLPSRIPLSQQKKFKRIKNLIIEEAVGLGEEEPEIQATQTAETHGKESPPPGGEAPPLRAGVPHGQRKVYYAGRQELEAAITAKFGPLQPQPPAPPHPTGSRPKRGKATKTVAEGLRERADLRKEEAE